MYKGETKQKGKRRLKGKNEYISPNRIFLKRNAFLSG